MADPSGPRDARTTALGDRLDTDGEVAVTGTVTVPWSDGICRIDHTLPAPAGVKRTVITQLEPGSRIAPEHLSCATASPPAAPSPTSDATPNAAGPGPGTVTVTVAWLARSRRASGIASAAGPATGARPAQSRPNDA